MSLPKRDGIHDRYYLIHKPDTSPEVLAEADLCIDDERSSLQEKFLHVLFKQYGFTTQSLPVLVHGVQSMQNLKPAKDVQISLDVEIEKKAS